MGKRDIFCTIAAQEDNLGDIEIRQRMLDLVSHPDVRLHISRGRMSDAYVAAFALPSGSRVYRSRVRHTLSLLGSVVLCRASILFPPGPYPLTSNRAALRAAGGAILSRIVRLTGGASITVGKSLRGQNARAIRSERALISASTVYAARDLLSAKTVGVDIESLPDLALMNEPSYLGGTREICAVSVRYDEALPPEFCRALAASCAELGLKPVLVSQVKRDDAQHSRLASELGWDAVLWEDREHAAQSERVRAAYKMSAVVVTDRLHSALIGLLDGAVPIAITSGGAPSKIRDAFDSVLPITYLDRAGLPQSSCLYDALMVRDETFAAAARASRRLAATRTRIHTALGLA